MNKENKTCRIGSTTIKIASVKTGTDAGGKHVDTQIVFFLNREKAVCHFYNTTQLILVNGHGFLRLVDEFLVPYFQHKIRIKLEDINKLNEEAFNALKSKKVKRASVRYKAGSTFPCGRCEHASNTLASLAKHSRNEHSLSLSSDSTGTMLALPFHSTRNNSINEEQGNEAPIQSQAQEIKSQNILSQKPQEHDANKHEKAKVPQLDTQALLQVQDMQLQEDISISDLTDDNIVPELKEEPLKYTCRNCDYKTKTKSHVEKHVKAIHKPEEKDINFICGTCEHIFVEEDNYNQHVKLHEEHKDKKLDKSKSPMMVQTVQTGDEGLLNPSSNDGKEEAVTLQEETEEHAEVLEVHAVLEDKCTKCDKVIRTDTSLHRHADLCEKCEQTFRRKNDLDVHVQKQHSKIPPQIEKSNDVEIENATFYCEKCGKDFEEFDALAKHFVKEHGQVTGEICWTCDKRFADSQSVQKHVKEEHENAENIRNQEMNQSDFICSLCGKVIRTSLGVNRHKELFCSECKKCSAERVSFDIHKQLHKIKPTWKCERCEFTTIDELSFNTHVQTIHKVIKIDINVEDQIEFKCDQCEYKCRLNRQLKNHKKSVHVEKDLGRLKCGTCDFTANYILPMWEHREYEHSDNVKLFYPKSKDMALTFLAEQGYDTLGEIETMKKDTKGCFIELTKCIGMGMMEASNEMNEKFNAVNTAIELLSKKLDAVLARQEEEVENKVEVSAHEVKASAPKVTETIENNKKPKKLKKSENGHIAWIGSSVSNVLDVKKLEQDTKTNVTFVKAYGIKEQSENTYPKEPQRFTDNTFKNIVPDVIEKNDIDILVMQTGDIEISNIKVNEALMDTSKDIQEYKQEWFDQVENDSKSLFNIAEEAIKKKPGLQVVIMRRLQRFDRSSQDILGIKAKLSNYANAVYDQLWTKRGCPENIKIRELELNVEKPGYLRNLIFGSENVKNFDGIHLQGRGASRHFTYRAVQTLKKILPQSRQPCRKENPQPDLSTDSHSDCPQARYQRQRRAELGKSYADVVKTSTRYSYSYSVPTSNRFNPLN